MDADIGAAVDRHDASSMNSTTGFDQLQREFNLDGIERPCFEQLVAYPRARMGSAHAVVEPVGDHRAVIGCGQHEGKLASDIAHEISSAGTQYDAGSNRITDKINAWRYFRHGPLGRFGRNCSSYSAFPCEFTQGAIQWPRPPRVAVQCGRTFVPRLASTMRFWQSAASSSPLFSSARESKSSWVLVRRRPRSARRASHMRTFLPF